MTKRKSFLMILAMILILPLAFMMYGCFGGNSDNNNTNNTPLPEGYYRITVQQTTGGSVTASKSSAQEGEEITLSYTTNNGYLFVKLTVKDGNNQEIELNDNKFTMPASDVRVSATFERISNQKYFLEIEPSIYYNIELISPNEEQLERNQGKISAGTRVVLGYEILQDGYEFKSWNVIDSNGNRVSVNSDNSFIMPNSNVIISAIVGEKTYTVSVDTETARIFNVTIRNEDDNNSIVENGGSVKYNDRITFSYEFKVQGYTLNYWENQNGERIYETGTLVQSNLVISATFSANQYSLRVNDNWRNDGEYNSVGVSSFYLTNKDGQRIDQLINTNERNKARTDDEITIHCEPSNQNFAVDYYILRYYSDDYGWIDANINANTFNMLPNSIEVSVKMKLVENTYNVNYVLDGGTVPQYAPRTFKSTDNTLDIPNPTREGYKFDGWEEQDSIGWASLDGAVRFYPFEFTEDLTLTAKWIKAATITYDYSHYSPYDLDGFNGKYVTDNNPSTYVLGETLILQNPIYAYGNFEGWYTSPTFEEESKITELYFEDENDLEDMTLYAKMRLKSFNINFVKIGVSTEGTTKMLANSAYLDWFNLAEDPRDLTRDDGFYDNKTYTIGYTFKGFFADADLTTPITEVSNELDHDITIYAKETLDTYTITYYANDVNTGTYGPITYLTLSYTIETESIFIPTYSNWDNAYGHWILRGWRLNNKDTGEYFECFTRIYPSANPEKFHGNLVFYAYYELQ